MSNTEIVSKRDWDSKTFDTHTTHKNKIVYATKIQNGLHDIEPNGSFVECNTLFQSYEVGVSTDKIIRNRCGEVRISDTKSESKDLVKIKTKNNCGISLKLHGYKTYGPRFNTLKDIYYDTYDGITVNYQPLHNGIRTAIIIDKPQTASNVYRFSLKEYGCTYKYKETNKGIHCISSTGKDDIYIKNAYAIDANENTGSVLLKLDTIINGRTIIKKIINPIWLGNAVGPVITYPDVTIDDDSGTIEDTLIIGASHNNYGALNNQQYATSRTELMKVDLSVYPNISISAARFGLDVFEAPGITDIQWHKILVSWVEGTKTGAIEVNSSDWLDRIHNTVPWNTAGCTGDGTDRQTIKENSALLIVNNNFHLDMTTVTVQNWIDSPSGNHGITIWRIPGAGINKARSSETVIGNKPYFYMEFTEGGVKHIGGLLETILGFHTIIRSSTHAI